MVDFHILDAVVATVSRNDDENASIELQHTLVDRVSRVALSEKMP